MWFTPQSQQSSDTPLVILDGSLLLSIVYLGVVILHWSSYNSVLCKKMAYYLYLIDWHQRTLLLAVLNMLVQSLVLSHLRYAVPVWGPLSELRFTVKSGETVQSCCWGCLWIEKIWPCMCFEETWMAFCSVTDPAPLSANVVSTLPCWNRKHNAVYLPIQFSRQSYYETRTAPYFAVPCRFKFYIYAEVFSGMHWCNSLSTYVLNSDGYYGFKTQTFQHLLDND